MIIRNLEAIFSFRYNPEKLKKATASLDDFAHKANLAISAIAGSAAVIGLKNFMDNTAQALDQIGKTSSKLGVSVNALQEFRFAAEQSGLSTQTLDMALQRFIRRSAEAAKGSGEAKDALKELGVSVSDSSGKLRDPIDMLYEVADAMGKIPDQGNKIRLAMRLFDTEGVAMVNLLQDGSKGVRSLTQEARDLGFVLGKESTQSAANYNDAMNRLHKAFKGLTNALAVKLMPALTRLADFGARLAASFNSIENRTSTLRVALLALGGVAAAIAVKLAIAFAPVLLSITAIGVAIGVAALLIDDLWTAFQGGDSVLGSLHKKAREFFEPLEQWLLELPKKIWDGFVGGIKSAFDWIVNKINQLENFLPDFLKKGLFASIGLAGSGPEKINRWAPQVLPASNSIQNQSNQSVSVTVNAKTGASPHEIGGEVLKAIKRELEKERINAFMGVNYAY